MYVYIYTHVFIDAYIDYLRKDVRHLIVDKLTNECLEGEFKIFFVGQC